MKTKKLIFILLTVSCLMISILVIYFYLFKSSKFIAPSTEYSINPNPTFNLQGFNIAAWGKDWWHDDKLVEEALRFAKEEGANLVVLDWAVNFYDDGRMVSLDENTSLHPYWDDIKKIVTKAKAYGFYVILKPHTTLADSPENRNIWNTDISIFKPSNFFPAYKSYLIQLAEFANQNKVDAICIGTEINHLDWQFRDEWIDLISAIRHKFDGALTYDAFFNRWYYNVKDIDEVVFWDQLDFIGVSLYVPITTDDDASVETLKQGWFKDLGNWFEIDDVIAYLKDIANRYNKQIVALEGGYPSITGGLYLLNTDPSEKKYANYDLQSRGLDAYLSVLDENKENWLKGVSLWEITPYMIRKEALSSVYHKQGFTVYKKPAAEIVKAHYIKL
jgi:hypothetical protein